MVSMATQNRGVAPGYVNYTGPRLFGAPIGDLSAFQTVLSTVAVGFASFFFATFLGIVGLSVAGIAIPKFVLAPVLVYLFSIMIPIFPVGGWGGGSFINKVLPVVALGTPLAGYFARLTRGAMVETLSADFVRTATAKGLPRRRVVSVHIFRNSLIPVVTYLGIDIGNLMVGAIVTEGIFNIHGVGGTVFQAVKLGQGPTVVAFVAVMVIIFMLANLLVDLLYAVLDPRIRYA